jgi:hypothetical protein
MPINYRGGFRRMGLVFLILWEAITLPVAIPRFWAWWSNPFRQYVSTMSNPQFDAALPWGIAAFAVPIVLLVILRVTYWVARGFIAN